MSEWRIPSSDRVEAVNSERKPSLGPTAEYFTIDWTVPGKSKWTRAAAAVFTKEELEDRYRDLESPSTSEIEAQFMQYIVYLKNEYKGKHTGQENGAQRAQKTRSLGRRKQVRIIYATKDIALTMV